jgi:O-acetyl-ADP-ribose deacetylase (regulator of RNase III)
LVLADERGLKSIALPAISTGIFGYPLDEAARVMVSATVAYLKDQTALERVVFCLYGQSAYEAFVTALSELVDS